ncbi:MFS transporter [Bacillus sp. NPDC077027]|uniref:MFS transporter n=1 Tax=Bacillus sp. NPDC077027 TaxID=3390548 RepID=UPI003D01C1A2
MKERIWTRDFIMIVLVNLFTFISFYALLTLLPIYTIDVLNGTESQGGLLVTIFLLSAILTRPFSGAIIERFGKKRVAILSSMAFAFLTYLYIPIDHFQVLLVLRFIQGIFFSILTTVTSAIVVDMIPKKKRGEGLGYFIMSMNLAVVIGPFIALNQVGKVGFHTLFLLFSIIVTIGAVFTIFIRQPVPEGGGSVVFRFTLSHLFEKGALKTAAVGIIISFCYSPIISFISVYANSLHLMDASSYFFIVFAAAMLGSRPFTGKLFDRVGPSIVIYPSIALFALGLCMLTITHSATMLLLSGAVIGLGYGSLVPCLQTLAIQHSPAHRTGYATATFFTLYDSGIAAGSLIFGILVSFTDFSNVYLIAGILVLFSMVVFYWSEKKPTEAKTARQKVSVSE